MPWRNFLYQAYWQSCHRTISAPFSYTVAVEIINLDKMVRAWRVRQWAGIFRKTAPLAMLPHHQSAVPAKGMQTFGKRLVTKYGKSLLFKAWLKPVTAGDTVARPVMEVFMGNHRFDIKVTAIGGGLWARWYASGVKDI